jgi:hypothetical protein
LEELPQEIVPGDVSSAITTDGLAVKWELGESLLSAVHVRPAVLTPNEDGTNDEVLISYSLLQLTAPAPVSVGIYNTSGRLVWEHSDRQGNGAYLVCWDGRNGEGERMLPGIYIYRIVVDMKDRSYTHAGTLTILY